MQREVPPDLERALTQIERAHGARVAERLLQRYLAANERDRDGAGRAILQVARARRWNVYLWGLVALPAVAWGGQSLWDARYASAVRAGERAVAVVRRLEDGACLYTGRDHECVALTLRVTPAEGAPFDAQLTYELPKRWLPRVQAGSWVYVSRDRAEPAQVRLDEDALALPPPAPASSPPATSVAQPR